MERISTHQFFTFSAAVLLGTTFFPVGQVATSVAGRDSWWTLLPGYAIAIPWALMVLWLNENYPGKNLLEITERVFGLWVGRIACLLYILIVGYFGILLTAQGVDIFKRSILPLVPNYIVILGELTLAFMLIWAGTEVFARFTEIVFPMLFLGLVLIMLLSISHFEQEFYPLFENGLKPVFLGILKMFPYGIQYILILGAILPHLPTGKEKQLKTGIWRSVLLIGLLDALLDLTEIMVFGPEETKRINYGILALGKMIEIAKTISGVESVFILLWMGASIIKVGTLIMAAIIGVRTLLKSQKRKLWLYLGAIFVAGLIALTIPGGTYLGLEINLVAEYLIFPFTALWVPLLFFGARWRKGTQG